MTTITIDSSDVGVVIRATLTFTDFDPTGAAASLVYTSLQGGVETREMAFDGVSIATYTIAAGDFVQGYYSAQVQVRKNGVQVSSEVFQIAVLV